MAFKDRNEAGSRLARALSRYKDTGAVVFALPRGGVVTGSEVAAYLGAPLELVIARKIPHPFSPEYAVGAVTETGEPVWGWSEAELPEEDMWRREQVAAARAEARRRRLKYQGDNSVPDAAGRTAILVDDGLATGLTMVAAVREVAALKPARIVIAVPVAPRHLPPELLEAADEVVVLYVPPGPFGAIGSHYENFEQVSDEEVRQLLGAYRQQTREPLDIAAVNALLATVRRYPVTGGELATKARLLRSPKNVVQFFETIPPRQEFQSKADVMLVSDVTEILEEAEQREPGESLHSYEDPRL